MASLYYTGKHFGAPFVSIIAAVLHKSLESPFPLYFASKEFDSPPPKQITFQNCKFFNVFMYEKCQ